MLSSRNDNDNDDGDPEADPALLARRARAVDSLLRVLVPLRHVLVDVDGVVLDDVDRLVLLLDQHGHLHVSGRQCQHVEGQEVGEARAERKRG